MRFTVISGCRLNISGASTDKPDLDFWYNPSYKNYFNLLDAIEELGEDMSEFKKEKAPNPKKSFFKLNFEQFTIDFLPELPGLSKFTYSYAKKEVANIDGVDIFFIEFDDLIVNKLAIGREKDLIDIDMLKHKHKRDLSNEATTDS